MNVLNVVHNKSLFVSHKRLSFQREKDTPRGEF